MCRSVMPDLVLMDIQLPVISGLDVAKALKADDDLKHIPIIAVTAFAMKGDEEKDPRRRLRGLPLQADFAHQFPGDG